MAEEIQARYEELDRLASQVYRQSDRARSLLQRVRSQIEVVSRSWTGQGSEVFQREMEEQLLPGLKSLATSLEVTGVTIHHAMRTFQEAEEEAIRCLGDEEHIRFSPDLQEEFGIKDYDLKEGWGKGGFGIKQKIVDGEYYDFDNVKNDIRVAGADIGDYTYDAKVGTGEAGVGIETDEDGDLAVGGYFKASAGEVSADAVLGGESFGGTASGKIEGPVVEGFIGLKDGSVGGEVGGTIVSAEASAGVNVAGVNVGVTGGVMLGAKFGFRIGRKTVVKLGVFKVGLILGKSKVIQPGQI
ncbi:MAG: WXG100 family type VII secretion target [Anaerolineales bacterium]|nr:WXG100 family type VII secretion target [Anaerolineales bacterium]